MINFNNHNITAMTYNNHTIKKAYGCDGHLVWSGGTPVAPYKYIATYTNGASNTGECDSSTELSSSELPNPYVVTLDVGDCVTSIPRLGFRQHSSLTSVKLGKNVETLGYQAFYFDQNLTSVTIESSSIAFTNSCFHSCAQLKRLNSDVDGIFNLPSGTTEIGYAAFYQCAVKSIIIPDSVPEIVGDAFLHCGSLDTVVVGSGVTSIGDGAFNSCPIDSITIKAVTPPAIVVGIDRSPFTPGGYAPNKIFVPAQSVNAYKLDSGWGHFDNRIYPIP